MTACKDKVLNMEKKFLAYKNKQPALVSGLLYEKDKYSC